MVLYADDSSELRHMPWKFIYDILLSVQVLLRSSKYLLAYPEASSPTQLCIPCQVAISENPNSRRLTRSLCGHNPYLAFFDVFV